MSFPSSYTFATTTGLTVKAALIDTGGTIHATIRDITSGLAEIGGGLYRWYYASHPDGYRGSAVFYTGTLGAAANFSGVTVRSAASVNPGELERAEKALPDVAANAAGGLYTLGGTGVDIYKLSGSAAAATAIVAFARPVLKAVPAPSGSQYDPFYKYDGDYNGMPSWGGTNEIGALWWDTSSSPYGWTISATKGTQGASYFHRQTTAFDAISPDAPWDDGAAEALGNKFIGVGGYNGLTFVLHGTDRTAIDALPTAAAINTAVEGGAVGTGVTNVLKVVQAKSGNR